MHIHNSIILNGQKEEVTQVSVGGWMDKQNVKYSHSGISFNLKTEENFDTKYSIDEMEDIMLNEIS